MIENQAKDDVVAIICFCDTEEKIKILIDNINFIRNNYPNFKIAIQTNNPLPENIQQITDHYFYEDLNVFDNDVVFYWSIRPFFNKKFISSYKDYGLCVFQQIKHVSKYLSDYNKVLLMNYDTLLEQKHIDNHLKLEKDLLCYHWTEMSVSLILMSFKPSVFFEKVGKFLNYDFYKSLKNMIAEERFLQIIKKSDINYLISLDNVIDKICLVGLSYDSFQNDFFKKNIVCFNNNTLEIYLWDFLSDVKIDIIEIEIDENCILLYNNIKNIVFYSFLKYQNSIYNLKITKINEKNVNIPLKIYKNTVAHNYYDFSFSYDGCDKLFITSPMDINVNITIWNNDKIDDMIYFTTTHFGLNQKFWFSPTKNLNRFNRIKILISDMNDNLLREEYMILDSRS